MSPRRDRGVALVAATAALAILTILATSLARTSLTEQRLARHALAALQAEALGRSGVAAAAIWLDQRPDGPDTLAAPWGSGRQPLGAGWVDVQIEDEARRIDLNLGSDALPRLLQTLGLDPHLADAIADWTDPDPTPHPGGAERDHYLALPAPYLPADGPLGSVGELTLVRGVDRATLARLRPFVTTAGEAAVNPNTAPREVLSAVLGDDALADRLLAARLSAPIDAARLDELLPGAMRPRFTTRGLHYSVTAVGSVGDVRRAVEAVLQAPAGLDATIRHWRLRGDA